MTPLLTPEEAAAALGIGEDTLREMRKAGEIPYINIGRGKKRETPRYDPVDLEAWKQRRKTTACPSSSEKRPGTARTPTISSYKVVDFQARRKERLGAKQKR